MKREGANPVECKKSAYSDNPVHLVLASLSRSTLCMPVESASTLGIRSTPEQRENPATSIEAAPVDQERAQLQYFSSVVDFIGPCGPGCIVANGTAIACRNAPYLRAGAGSAAPRFNAVSTPQLQLSKESTILHNDSMPVCRSILQ